MEIAAPIVVTAAVAAAHGRARVRAYFDLVRSKKLHVSDVVSKYSPKNESKKLHVSRVVNEAKQLS